jgi:SAM-dependent methyltransferase
MEICPMSNLGENLEKDMISKQMFAWISGVSSEYEFWRHWLSTKGGNYPEDFGNRFSLGRQLGENIGRHLGSSRRILDVGAGPVSTLGKYFLGESVDLIAIDPLASMYNDLLNEFELTAETPTILGFAEDLTTQFSPQSFDVIHCSNALDHSLDPLRALEEMLVICKEQGVVILNHSVNEAEKAGYQGLHQWNFDVFNGHFIIWNKHQRVDVNELYGDYARIEVSCENSWISVELHPTKTLPLDLSKRHSLRVHEILGGLVDFAVHHGVHTHVRNIEYQELMLNKTTQSDHDLEKISSETGKAVYLTEKEAYAIKLMRLGMKRKPIRLLVRGAWRVLIPLLNRQLS